MLITPAYAQAAGGGGGDFFISLMPLLLIFVVFYFLLIRPQQRKVKLHQDMVAAIKRGDQVATSGGILGKVTKVDDQEGILSVEIAKDVVVRVYRHTISDVLSKPQPVANNNSAAASTTTGQSGGGFFDKLMGKK